ncbi:hypothetical protein GWK47_040836 [Chionoecetes opilio]|uniref:Nucleoprotein TPR/MPL1 domain-containing protein n=1 Tax=Chionoecetes opilio TaxID=41210 RepID=A0A8J4YIC1_CHIOP|nr:hypothetical protein GWK47_040836 [Chionoecetes opilio]
MKNGMLLHSQLPLLVALIQEINKYKNSKSRGKRLEQEHGLLSRQIGVLQHQLEQRTEETVKQRQEHSSIILGLQTDLNHKLEELFCYLTRLLLAARGLISQL